MIAAVLALHAAVIFALVEWPGHGVRSLFAHEIWVTIVPTPAAGAKAPVPSHAD